MKHMTNVISRDRICMGHFGKREHVRTSKARAGEQEDAQRIKQN